MSGWDRRSRAGEKAHDAGRCGLRPRRRRRKCLLLLTAHRPKPAVRFGGSFRFIDYPLNNYVNSEIPKVLVFSQYKSFSLEYHLRQGRWSIGSKLHDYIAFLPPQKRAGRLCYQGTVDAVYQNLPLLDRLSPANVLILGSDHVYLIGLSPSAAVSSRGRG